MVSSQFRFSFFFFLKSWRIKLTDCSRRCFSKMSSHHQMYVDRVHPCYMGEMEKFFSLVVKYYMISSFFLITWRTLSLFSCVSFLDEVSDGASAAAKKVYSIYFSLLIESTPLLIYSVCKMKLYCRIEVFTALKHQTHRPLQRRCSGVAVKKRTDLSPFLVAHALSVENTNCKDKRLTLTTPVNTNSYINSTCS